MEADKIIEGNKLIAEFMGGIIQKDLTVKGYTKMNIPRWAFQSLDFDILTVGGYDYDSSWDWLMPVVEKIEALEDIDFILITRRYMNINRKTTIMEETVSNPSKVMGRGKAFIETVYDGVVRYIKLYNQLTPNSDSINNSKQ